MKHWAVVAFLLFVGSTAYADDSQQTPDNQPAWDVWLEGVRQEALENGIRQETIDVALTGIQPLKRIVANDRSQAEVVETAETYLSKRVSSARIENGRKFLAQHADLLARVAAQYGVQPRYIVAIWGMETNYGLYKPREDAVTALATLAYDPRRGSYFRKELLAALQILDEGHIDHADMRGSWAGAMGQSQFMPTSFVAYAVDFDGDGKRDIWTNEADIFGSIANYLAARGWRDDHNWGRKILLPEGFNAASTEIGPSEESGCRALKAHTKRIPLSEWRNRGVRADDGSDLPEGDISASLVRPDGPEGDAYLTYGNFRALLGYNCTNLYALAVGHLAESIQ
ncbi:MAG: lytic murein transglycosylase [Proteobacteria bacterium]|nr:lytic murein transglycosylase [Pseudomonadota bacterium]